MPGYLGMGRQKEQQGRVPGDVGSERRGTARFPLDLEVRYTGSGGQGLLVTGSGRTTDLSSSGLAFISDNPLPHGLRLDLSIDWPVLLDGAIQLQLTISGVVVRTSGSVTALRIQRHEFKTRRVGLRAVPPQKSAG